LTKTRKAGARREQILKAAEKIFAEKGFHETTVSDIAKGAGLSEPTLYEYFSSKEDILFTIPEETSCKLGELIDFHLKMTKGTAAKLRAMIYIIFWIHQTDPSYAAVSYLILKQSGRFTKSEGYAVLRQRLRPLIDVVEEGIASGEIRAGFSPYFVRSVILGTIEHLTTRKVLLGTEDNLLDYVDPLMDLLLDGIRPDKAPGALRLKVTIEPESGEAPANEVIALSPFP
jgi:TetR/AcrR family transcriptional regulator, fatty acid metabolism regulator protein